MEAAEAANAEIHVLSNDAMVTVPLEGR